MTFHIGLIGGGNITETHARAAGAIPGVEISAIQGIAAARHGLHVLTEKPIDTSTARADALIEAAKQSKVQLGVIFQDRMKPHIRQLKNWLDQGLLGKLLFVYARVKWYRPPEYYANSSWRGTHALDGGGALINQGVHTIDLLLWLLGDVARVQARTATLLHESKPKTPPQPSSNSPAALWVFSTPP